LYYDENINFVLGTRNMRGVRQGRVLGMFLFCLTMEPVYARLRAAVGDEGVLYTYRDESYILAPMENMAEVVHQAPGIFGKVGLRIGYGPRKTEIVLPQSCPREVFPYPLDNPQVPAPHVVDGFRTCLGVPIHSQNDPEFLHNSLRSTGAAHDR
jgi:hypothetical protein